MRNYLILLKNRKNPQFYFVLMLALILMLRMFVAGVSTPTNSIKYPESFDKVPAKALLQGAKIDINQASAAVLESIPQIGPKRAQAIVALRVKLGFFESAKDLMKVKGIGQKRLDQITPYVVVHSPQ